MKQSILLVALVATICNYANANTPAESTHWKWNEKVGWTYVGEALTDTLTLDMTIQAATAVPGRFHANAFYSVDTKTTSAYEDAMVEFGGFGIYKWQSTSRGGLKDGSASVTKVGLLNTGMSMDAAYAGNPDSCFRNNAIASAKRPAIYVPTFKNGVKEVYVTYACSKARSFFNAVLTLGKNSADQDSLYWKSQPYFSSLASWSIKTDTLKVNATGQTEALTLMSYGSTDYAMILAITVVPQPKTPTNLNEATLVKSYATNNGVVIATEQNRIVNVYGLAGSIVASVPCTAHQQEFVTLPRGFYIVEGNKMVVR